MRECPMLRGACGSGWTPILFHTLSFDCWGGSRIVVSFSQHSSAGKLFFPLYDWIQSSESARHFGL
jgi:hypothetical protein